MMKNTRKNRKRKAWSAELKIIEKKLHPSPLVNGVEIAHMHHGKEIVFTAWVGDRRLNEREIRVTRQQVLCADDFYTEYAQDIAWITKNNIEEAA
jgi:hypothetical protein